MTQMVLENVEVLWPRINQPYRFVRNAAHPNGKGDQQPCGHLEPNAAYTLTMRLTGEQTKMLWAKMKEAYNNDKSPTWAAEPENRFKKDKDKETGEPNGYYLIQAGKKASYDGKTKVNPPLQVDKRAVPLPEDFELTTNSICNLSIQLKPYSMNEDSVSIRLHGVQVVELKERVEHNPFKPVEGADDNQASPFNNLEAQSAVSSKVDHPFGEEYEAPAQPPKNDLDDEIPF